LVIPEGYSQVVFGIVLEGDQFLNLYELTGDREVWETVGPDDIGQNYRNFRLLIRENKVFDYSYL
jgi:hypothetical protein